MHACGAERALSAARSPPGVARTRRLRRVRTRAALPDDGAPAEKPDAQQAASRTPGGPVDVVVWGGNLPSPRRAALGGLGALTIVFGGNLGGATSRLLASSPERARALRLDALFPVGGHAPLHNARDSSRRAGLGACASQPRPAPTSLAGWNAAGKKVLKPSSSLAVST